jgi:hypothetical protein
VGGGPGDFAGCSQPTPYPLPISLILRTEMLLHELFFEWDKSKVYYAEKENWRNDEPKRFDREEASDGDE